MGGFVVSRLLVSALLVSLLGAGCAATTSGKMPSNVRAGTTAETRVLTEALGPLLRSLDEPIEDTKTCPVGFGVVKTPRINASIALGKPGACPRFAILLTEGALTRLPVGMLRAMLAHELGHLVLKHTGRNTNADEVAADEFAAKLLKRLETRHPGACLQLVYVFSVLADPGGAAWFAVHPSPDRRAESALARCNE